jgi:hypothetical protein
VFEARWYRQIVKKNKITKGAFSGQTHHDFNILDSRKKIIPL